jgi:hypothetical protein
MKDSIWAYLIIMFGIIAIVFIFFMQRTSTSDQHNYTLLRETAEAAMYDAIDEAEFEKNGIIKINQEKFVENFLRRFAENASLSRTYVIDIYDINEEPPKVSIKVSSTEKGTSQVLEFDLVNKVDAILETKY